MGVKFLDNVYQNLEQDTPWACLARLVELEGMIRRLPEVSLLPSVANVLMLLTCQPVKERKVLPLQSYLHNKQTVGLIIGISLLQGIDWSQKGTLRQVILHASCEVNNLIHKVE